MPSATLSSVQNAIVGIDEVGRGCWAGPVVAGAVLLSEPIAGLKDSKKLTKLQRERLAAQIQSAALAVGLGWVEAAVIDEIGLTEAVRLAMRRALERISVSYDAVIIDGNLNYLMDVPGTQALIKADDIIPSVSAASIVAKVARDSYMANLGEGYSGYRFDTHVGYGTALHLEKLRELGVSDQHRRSFKPIRTLLAESS